MSGRTIGLKGGPELMAFLDQLPKRLEKNVLRGAMRAAAGVVRDEARSRVPAKSGKLRRAIKTDTVTDGGLIKARVKLRGKHSFVGVFLEYGVQPHFIRAGDAGISARLLTRRARAGGVTEGGAGVLNIGGQFVSGAVLHPGIAARPFLRPALDARADDAVRAAADYLNNRLRIGDFSAPRLELDTG